jgi:hypothetical protein
MREIRSELLLNWIPKVTGLRWASYLLIFILDVYDVVSVLCLLIIALIENSFETRLALCSRTRMRCWQAYSTSPNTYFRTQNFKCDYLDHNI